MNSGWVGIILAAGKGVRMKSSKPKTLHEVCGVPMLRYVCNAVRGAGVERIVAVASPALKDDPHFIEAAGEGARVAVQKEQRGTADAVLAAEALCRGAKHVVVGAGDTPLIRDETVRALINAHKKSGAAVTVLTALDAPVAGLGRVIREPAGTGRPVGIIEEREATPEQRQVKEVNTSWYCFEAAWMWAALREVRPSRATGELYLTGLVQAAALEKLPVAAVLVGEPIEALGVNDRSHLARAEGAMRERINNRWMAEGVTLVDPATTYIGADVRIGRDTVLQPGVHLRGRTVIGVECQIGPDSVITDCTVSDRSRVAASFCEGAKVGADVSVGPFSRLRPGTVIGDRARIGNFAEVKESLVAEDVRISHFSYTGDTRVGRNVNIGAGSVTCNYDGEQHNKTLIGNDVFIGSGTLLVAPREVGDGAATGAGAVVTRDIPAGELWVGNPARLLKKVPYRGRRKKT